MPRMTNESGRQPGSERFQPIIIKDGLLGKLGMGLFCSTIVAIVMNFAGLKWLVVHVFALFLSLFGRDVYDVKPKEAVKAAARDAIGHYKGEARKAVAPATLPVALPGIGQKSPEQLKFEADQKEAERKRREESERKTLLARADVVGLEYEDDWPLEKLRIEVRRAEDEAEEAAKKKPLLTRADKIGLQVDPTVDSKALKHQVEEGEREAAADADYQARLRQYERDLEAWKHRVATGPNARCINPKCRYAMHISDGRLNTKGVCPRCGTFFPCRAARANFTPPPPPREPLPPKKNPGLLKRVFG